jgi:arsenate reductase
MNEKKENVLFLCTSNSARSQMAEALLRKHAGNRYDVFSAGVESGIVHPLAIRVMSEMGIDISGQRSKNVSEYLGKIPITHAIFVCERAQKNCPTIYPFALKVASWPFEDPAAVEGSEEERLQKFRDVRNRIEEKIKAWLVTNP